MINVYNSLTRKTEELRPLFPPQLRMYTCGVTVYDDCHVGHARSLFIFDVIKKYLQYRGFQVTLVRNITDVDDKIINRARQDGVTFEEIRARYIRNYERDLDALSIARADHEPMATENIPSMVEHIQQLIAKGSAYAVDGDVYFAVRTFKDYGRLSGQTMDEMQTAVRIEKDEKKRDPLDFALWKKSREGEPGWPSPWGPGRPGWHIECSTMSLRYLKTQTLDIHAGGLDLIFPHHENEIAQAEALTGKPFAKYWIHHGLLTIEGRKMSKSLGNFYTIQDVLKKYPADVLKLFFLGAHYRSAMDFTFEGLDQSRKAYEKIKEFLDKAEGAGAEACVKEESQWSVFEKRFMDVMDDDFNTAQALAVVFDMVSFGNKNAAGTAAARKIKELLLVLGVSFTSAPMIEVKAHENIRTREQVAGAPAMSEEERDRLIEERRRARQNRDFKRADEIRDFLRARGILVDDKEKIR